MKISQAIKITGLALASMVVLTACASTDTVGKFAVKSFDAMAIELEIEPAYDDAKGAWALTTPTGERFLMTSDFAGQTDVTHELDLQTFVTAGLDVALLDQALYQVDEANGKLLVVGDLGSDSLGVESSKSMKDAVEGIVKNYRESIGYHSKLDHYGIAMGNGNMLEWASDMSKNDKDLVIVLNPEPLIAAGVDPTKLEGWAYAEVEMMDENENPIFMFKFLKPFEIKN